MPRPTFSICIPNFNYASFIDQTVQSALAQRASVEVVVSDNASTDNSVEVVRAIDDPRVRVRVNNSNVGFAGNLDRAVAMAEGRFALLVSSDDLIGPDALEAYGRIVEHLGERADQCLIGSSTLLIDGEGTVIGEGGPATWAWGDAHEVPELSELVGARVLEHDAGTLLGHSLRTLRTPFYFATLAYPRELWEAVEGYRGTQVINPDKAFAWRALGHAQRAYFVDKPLFSYRMHNRGQNAQQAASGALKFTVDQYTYTFDLEEPLLQRAGVTRDEIASAFVREDIALRGLAALADGDRRTARRLLRFGQAAFPDKAARDRLVLALRALSALGPLGSRVAGLARARRASADQINWTDSRSAA
jgi:hypothetical protein